MEGEGKGGEQESQLEGGGQAGQAGKIRPPKAESNSTGSIQIFSMGTLEASMLHRYLAELVTLYARERNTHISLFSYGRNM